MTEKLYTQREFSDLAGISTATTVKLLKEGTLKRDVSGKIPSSELRRFYIDFIKRYSAKGTFIICIDDTDEVVADIKTKFENLWNLQTGSVPNYITSVDDLVSGALQDVTGLDSAFYNELQQEKYNRRVLTQFITRYKGVVADYLVNLLSEGKYDNLLSLPCNVLWEYFLCDKLPDNITEDMQSILSLNKEKLSMTKLGLDNRFTELMNELSIKNMETGVLLFSRSDLTLDFFNKEGSLYNSFFFDSNGKKNPVHLGGCSKLTAELANATAGKRFKSNIDKMLSNGFYSVVNIKYTLNEVGKQLCSSVLGEDEFNKCINNKDASLFSYDKTLITTISTIVNSGIFSSVLINCSSDDMQTKLPKELLMSLDIAISNNNITLGNIVG